MKQNLDKSNCIQLFHNNCRVPKSPEWMTRHWEFNLSSPTREFILSHMPNSLDTNRNKIKVVRVFDSMCGNVVWGLAEYYDLWYVLANYSRNHKCCSLQLLLVYHATRWSVYKKIVT